MTVRLVRIAILTMLLLATSCSSNSIPHLNMYIVADFPVALTVKLQ